VQIVEVVDVLLGGFLEDGLLGEDVLNATPIGNLPKLNQWKLNRDLSAKSSKLVKAENDDPFGEWITDCVLMATRLEPNSGQTAHTKLSRVDEQEPLLNDLIRC